MAAMDVLASPTKLRAMPSVAPSPVHRVEDRARERGHTGAHRSTDQTDPAWALRRPVYHSLGVAVSSFAMVHSRLHADSATRHLAVQSGTTVALQEALADAEAASSAASGRTRSEIRRTGHALLREWVKAATEVQRR